MGEAEADSSAAQGRVLVADDFQSIRDGLANSLAQHGYEVVTVPSPAATQEKLAHETFDAALISLTMPGMNGVELIKEVKKHHPQLPVIVTANASEQPLVVEASNHGAETCILKPFNHIRRILDPLAEVVAAGRRREAGAPNADGERAECEDCHFLFSLPEWQPRTECPLCGSKNTLVRVAPGGSTDGTAGGSGGPPPLRDLRFGRIAKWAGLVTSPQIVECAILQWEAAKSGKPVPPIDELMVAKGYVSKDYAVRIRKFQALPKPTGEENRFAKLALGRTFITDRQYRTCFDIQAEMMRESGRAPSLAEILLETGAISESRIVTIFQQQFKKERKSPLQYFGLKGGSLSSVLAKLLPSPRAYSKEQLVAMVLAVLLVVGVVGFFVLKQRGAFRPQITVIDSSGGLRKVASGNIEAPSKEPGKGFFFPLYCKKCAVHFPLKLLPGKETKFIVQPCPTCNSLDQVDLPDSVKRVTEK